MKKILDLMEGQLKAAFSACGYDETFAKVVLSNRPDLCEYQCNGSMAAARFTRLPLYWKDRMQLGRTLFRHMYFPGALRRTWQRS